MSPLIAYMLAVGLGLLVLAVFLEVSDDREKRRRSADEFAEFEAWKRARNVTGRL